MVEQADEKCAFDLPLLARAVTFMPFVELFEYLWQSQEAELAFLGL